jgi:hypothetical protein
MRLHDAAIFLALVLLFSCSVGAQEKAEREIEIHTNVRLILMAIPPEMPKELRARYQQFLPLFEEALKESTSDRGLESALTIRLVPDMKEIGSAKTKRAIARVTAYRKDSKREFIGNFLLYNYSTGETVNKKDIEQFLKKQILNPMGLS